ncbi:amino acid ABC transporter permease [Pseudonocardia parietis]|uniref:Polar amino acid transport system permease protein n=1 Tax=Pseudonocardia parietis TaxID=570936 RepID=A0ABS4W358_9PSEU|nr:amino acid ABC transporter permease [Pseudonocardia parietis]MBP2370647.1 polar amino acid transport system permease protein [Pseudonocardia parietis]
MTTTAPSSRPSTRTHDVATAHARFRPGRWVASGVLLLIAVELVAFLIGNERFQWDVVAAHLFAPSVLRGLGTTLLLAVLAMVIGSVVGGALAAAQLSEFGPIRWAATIYVGVFRGIPPLVQLIFWFNLAYLVPEISIGVPFGGPDLVSWDANDLITPLTAGVIGLSLVQSAYMAEIIRAGILGVDQGQREAASAMGFTAGHTFFRIVLPQAMRVIIPPSGSQFITVVKGTALVSVIAMNDLLHSVQVIYNQTYEIVPMLLVACIWYLAVVTLLTIGQRRLEHRFARGHVRTVAPGGAS